MTSRPAHLVSCLSLSLSLSLGSGLQAQAWEPAPTPYSSAECPSCTEWNTPTPPFRLHGNTYYVGTRGLSAILITSTEGHVLIDGGLPESAPQIAASVQALGFRVEDIRLIVNSHAHYDHAGGIAAIQRRSGATVAASAASAPVLRSGRSGPDDPQFAVALAFPPIAGVGPVADGETLTVGPIALTAQFTAGHTPGGTSWSWRSCDGPHCLAFVYADSQTPVSADGFLFTKSDAYPTALTDFARGFERLESVPCDVLVTPHPAASKMWERFSPGGPATPRARAEPDGCRQFAAAARARLARRVALETGRP